MENKMYDIIIIGAGPAGMTAAVYAGRSNKEVALIDKNGFGGNIANSPIVENIPGFKSISGIDFATNLYEQVCALPTINHIIDEAVLLNYKHGMIIVSLASGEKVFGKSLIIATGTEHKMLDLPTQNIYYCATCDGPLFKNKSVIVVGSGNTGATYALDLANYCKQVYLCDITTKMCCEPVLSSRIEKSSKISWLPNCSIKSVTNNKEGKLTSITLSTYESIKVAAIFSAIGMSPKTDFTNDLVEKNTAGFIKQLTTNTTLVPNIFVAGDCADKEIRQVTTACSDGTIAAIHAIKYLDTL